MKNIFGQIILAIGILAILFGCGEADIDMSFSQEIFSRLAFWASGSLLIYIGNKISNILKTEDDDTI